MLSCADEAVPVVANVFWRATDLRHNLSHHFRRDHLYRVPRTDRQFIRIGFLLRNVHANFATDTPFQIDLAPGLYPSDAEVALIERDAIDRADLKT